MVVSEAMPELEAEGVVFGLELLADLIELFPGLGEGFDADLRKPVGAPVHELADIAERDCLPFAVHHDGFFSSVIPAALRISDVLGNIADVQIFLAELYDLEQ